MTRTSTFSEPATGKANRFRLLIIGKTGCGKTTILSKVCGEDMVDAPSTSRGHHDIEREILFRRNDKLVAHDSEGFEVGQSEEVDVVKNFIRRRSKAKDINERLHMIWYCIEMGPRPIQHAEKEFFSVHWQVPVIVVITKFDVFVQDISQKLEEAAEENDEEIDDDQLDEDALRRAKVMFDMHVGAPLTALPCPPKAVLALSGTHEATLTESGLAELIQEAMKALTEEEEAVEGGAARHQLGVLFATAQTLDVKVKLEISTCQGIVANYDKSTSSISRYELVDVWNTDWSRSPEKLELESHLMALISILSRHINDGPRMIGHPESEDYWEVQRWRANHLRSCQREQIVADTVLIMEKVFLLQIKDATMLEELLKWYTRRSIIPTYVRGQLMKEHRLRKGGSVGMDVNHLCAIVSGRPLEGSIY